MLRRVNTRLDTSKWLDEDFAGAKIKNFDEMRENFIDCLTNQFSDLLVPAARNSVKLASSTPLLLETLANEDEGDEEHKSDSSGEASADDAIAESDEEDSNMIPDEKPEDVGNALGDSTAMEIDLIAQINQLESQERDLDEGVKQKEALLGMIKQQ